MTYLELAEELYNIGVSCAERHGCNAISWDALTKPQQQALVEQLKVCEARGLIFTKATPCDSSNLS